VCTPEVAVGAVSRYLGLLATTAGRTDAAPVHLERAVEENTRFGARPFADLARADLERCRAHA
jgi:hypothetical protein